jgi:hypothetical protein
MTTFRHTEQAIAVSRKTGWDLNEYATEHGWSGVAIGPVGQHRDSDTLARCNFDVIVRVLVERFGDAVATVSFGHWAVGWVEEIASDAGREDVQTAIQGWRDALANYPVADETAWSAMEVEESIQTIEAILPSYLEFGDVEYELNSSGDWAGQVFSALFAMDCNYSPGGMRGDDVEHAAMVAGVYFPVVPLVEL